MDGLLDSPGITTEQEKVEAWRLHVLIEVGYPVELAEQLAVRIDVDLHQAVALVKDGCAPAVALQILV